MSSGWRRVSSMNPRLVTSVSNQALPHPSPWQHHVLGRVVGRERMVGDVRAPFCDEGPPPLHAGEVREQGPRVRLELLRLIAKAQVAL